MQCKILGEKKVTELHKWSQNRMNGKIKAINNLF